MSRIGKQPIEIPDGVQVTISSDNIEVKGPKGTLTENRFPGISVEQKDSQIVVSAEKKNPKLNVLWGTNRALIANLVQGVSTGFSKTLEVHGVGYNANVQGKKLVCELGFSHPKEIDITDGLEVKVDKSNIIISGADKQAVGQFAAKVRDFKTPEPYKGKGIRYSDEYVARKEGKRATAEGE